MTIVRYDPALHEPQEPTEEQLACREHTVLAMDVATVAAAVLSPTLISYVPERLHEGAHSLLVGLLVLAVAMVVGLWVRWKGE